MKFVLHFPNDLSVMSFNFFCLIGEIIRKEADREVPPTGSAGLGQADARNSVWISYTGEKDSGT